ncbi:protein CURVATURE THYLAKOID 1A, chloroplastic-like [Oryza brachyantha]|uniref:protein CURVATURE THYLAKOID 1A, chloroplastic-like n=1 Tax=Oryza brachyantha TaxID=4533 RepID=UPI001ADB6EC5|nr:protein CURVATURE THYLAKOID 1A, chloroplastic-like [Oryza brachyantha]
MAAATAYTVALLGAGAARVPAAAPRSAVLLPRRGGVLRLQDAPRLSLLRVRAASEDTSTSASGDELVADLKAKWEAIEDKPTFLLYSGGAVVALWLTTVVVGAINSVPLLPKILELVGLGYTGWFVYRYLLFKESRKELATDIETLKKKIAGTE